MADGGFNPLTVVPSSAAGVTFGQTGNSGGDAKTVFVHLSPGASTAGNVVNAMNGTSDVAAVMTATLDPKDKLDGQLLGLGAVELAAFAVLANGNGQDLDLSSGLQIINGGQTYLINFNGSQSLQQLLNVINGAGANLLAKVNNAGTGIDIQSTLSGADLYIGENGGTTASQLGIRSLTAATKLDDLNHGLGVDRSDGTDFTIRRNDGVELEIDLSAATTIQDVLDAINNHTLNQDTNLRVEAKIPIFGNGIELVDSTAEGNSNLTVLKGPSGAAWDLGFVPRGETEVTGGSGPPAAGAASDVRFVAPNDVNTAFRVEANIPGPHLNGVAIEFVSTGAVVGDAATVTYDPLGQRLVLDIDSTATTIATIVNQISLEGTFAAELIIDGDESNNGSGLIPTLGVAATVGGGVANTAANPATLSITFPNPFDTNTALIIQAINPGIGFNNVQVLFIDSGAVTGDYAEAIYDANAKTLTIDIDSAVTTANAVVTELLEQPLFSAKLDTTQSNNGTGVIGFVGSSGTLQGGTAEVLRSADVNPEEVKGVFNSLTKLAKAISIFDLRQIERTLNELDRDFDRVNFSRAEIGARQRFLDVIERRSEDEELELRRVLSLEIDTDFIAAISELTGKQASLQASLKLYGSTFGLTLLDYL